MRIRDADELISLQRSWRYHHPITDEALLHAGRQATIASVGYYHGGDVLYELQEVPGMWHEACLDQLTTSDSDGAV